MNVDVNEHLNEDQERLASPQDDGHAATDDLHGPEFDRQDVLFGLLSILFFILDVGSDIYLARYYYHQKNLLAFYLTTAFVVGPSLITCILNFRWYLLDYKSLLEKYDRGENVKLPSKALWLTRFALTILMMTPVIRLIEYIYNGLKSRCNNLTPQEKKIYYNLMRQENVDACCTRMIECFLEAAPQLVLQIYVFTQQESRIVEWIKAVAILLSWASLTWSMVAYNKALRLAPRGEKYLSNQGIVFLLLWRACEIGPRVIALGLCAAQFDYIVLIGILVHWIAMSFWLFCQKTQFYQNRCEERVFNIVCGYILIFCFLNVRGGRTRYRMLVYYFIIYAQNWIMMGFWFYFTDNKSQWFYIPTFFVVSFGVILQIFFQLLYYRCFHPLGRGKIPCCADDGEYTCYQSVCHELEPDENNYLENPQNTK